MEFDEFSGLMVLNMRASEGNGSILKYETKLGEGKFTISYATDEKVAQVGKAGLVLSLLFYFQIGREIPVFVLDEYGK